MILKKGPNQTIVSNFLTKTDNRTISVISKKWSDSDNFLFYYSLVIFAQLDLSKNLIGEVVFEKIMVKKWLKMRRGPVINMAQTINKYNFSCKINTL
jgi:hypothetical protein